MTITESDIRAALERAADHDWPAQRGATTDPSPTGLLLERRPTIVPGAAGPQRTGSTTRRAIAVVGVAAAVLLVGGITWVARPPGDTPDTVVADDPPAEPGLLPHVATDLPDGLVRGGEMTFDEATPDRGWPTVATEVYGPATDDPRLGVALVSDLVFGEALLGPAAEVEGGDGRTLREVVPGVGLGPAHLVTGLDQPVVLLGSLSEAELLPIAETIEIEAGSVTLPPTALPSGWSSVGTEPDAGSLGAPSLTARTGPAYVARYEVPSEVTAEFSRLVSVTSVDAGDGRLAAVPLLLDDVHEAQVQGHRALIGKGRDGPSGVGSSTLVVSWVDGGTLVRVAGTNLDEAGVLAVAAGVERVSTADWDDLTLTARAGDDPEVGRGRFGDGGAWVLRADPERSAYRPTMRRVELEVAGGRPLEVVSGSWPSGHVPFDVVTVSSRAEGLVAFGTVASDVTRVELRRPDGSSGGTVTMVGEAGALGWVAEVAGDPVMAVAAVALDASGAELDRIDLDLVGRGD